MRCKMKAPNLLMDTRHQVMIKWCGIPMHIHYSQVLWWHGGQTCGPITSMGGQTRQESRQASLQTAPRSSGRMALQTYDKLKKLLCRVQYDLQIQACYYRIKQPLKVPYRLGKGKKKKKRSYRRLIKVYLIPRRCFWVLTFNTFPDQQSWGKQAKKGREGKEIDREKSWKDTSLLKSETEAVSFKEKHMLKTTAELN